MQDNASNKMMSGKDIKNKSVEDYFFPEYQMTISAGSLEEATEKLKIILKKK